MCVMCVHVEVRRSVFIIFHYSQFILFFSYNIDVSQSLSLFVGVSTEGGESETEVTSGGTQSPGTDCITSSVAHLIG